MAYLLGQAREQPLVILIEDLHWTDPTTLELLDQLVGRITTHHVLLLVTFRAEFIPPWRGRPHVSLISLNRLSRRQGIELIGRLCAGRTLPSDVTEQILARSDGIPLYLEELTKAVLEDSGSRDLRSKVAIPATLHDSLVARLDRYPTAKRVAQYSAVIGREFSYSLLAEITNEQGRDLQAALQELVSAELIFARGTPPDATYTFKHALVRDAAYESLLKARRQEIHARIAATLEADAYVLSRQPELVAYHLGEARLPERAVIYWERAANEAAARHAHHEAIGHCDRGLEVASLIEDRAARLEHELKLQVRLGNSAIAAKGWSAPEVGQAFYRARELCGELQDGRLLHAILVGLFYFHSFQAELHLAEALGLELLTLGEDADDRVLQVGGHKVLVDVRYKLAKCCCPRMTGQGHGVERAVMNSRGERYPSALWG
jgi:predicted ATPase